MATQQTIEDLRQAEQRLGADYANLESKLALIKDAILQKSAERTAVFQQLNRAPRGSAERRALEQQYANLNQEIELLTAEERDLGNQMVNLDAQIQRIERQIVTLQNGGTINQSLPVTESVTTNEGTTTIIGDPFNDENAVVQQEPVIQGDPFNDPNTTIRSRAPQITDPYVPPPEPENIENNFSEAERNLIDQTADVNRILDARPIPNSQNPKNSVNSEIPPDWRVRLSLATASKASNYLYNADNPGILLPLKSTRGVIFPYTPQISISYLASYDQQLLTHSNYKFNTYQGSAVENITVTGDFTAQNVDEANYVLAVIHFFRSATKMFYGQDSNPGPGVPPPLVYLSGHGAYQFDNHPAVISNFTYTLPNDVDYVNAYPNGATIGATDSIMTSTNINKGNYTSGPISSEDRLRAAKIKPGGYPLDVRFPKTRSMVEQLTRVPTKISLSITLLPVMTRYAVSNKFSLRDYATGALLRGSKNTGYGGGMW